MAKASTSTFAQYVLEVETATAGTWASICGLTSRNITRQSNITSTSVPDCDDESLPASVEKDVESASVTVSASGVFAKEAAEMLSDWWYSAGRKNVRIHHMNAAVGDTEFETGPALLASFNTGATRGQKVSLDISIEFDGLPVRTAATV